MRRFVQVLALVIVLAMSSAASAQATIPAHTEPGTVDVQRIVIRDEEGRVRIELAVIDGEPTIRMLSETGVPVCSLTAIDVDILEMNSTLNTALYALTPKVIKNSFYCVKYRPDGSNNWYLGVVVDTRPQVGWNVYIGEGKFSVSDDEVRRAYREAGETVVNTMLNFLAMGTDPDIIVVDFRINSVHIGVYTRGVMELANES